MRKGKEIGGSDEKPTSRKTTGVCKPRSGAIPWVVLSDLVIQAHRDNMTKHAIICKFMGLWMKERALHVWIRSHRKPRGEIYLHLRSRGFFTVVFASLEDKVECLKGDPISTLQRDSTSVHGC